jgi:chorismate mutase
MNNRRERGNQRGLDDEFITRIFESIHEESISRQSEIMNKALSKKEK